VALVFILAEGGLTTRWQNLRPAVGLGVLLGTVSFAVSTVIAAAGVRLLFDFD
jgi:potassium/hydrogen antiporter